MSTLLDYSKRLFQTSTDILSLIKSYLPEITRHNNIGKINSVLERSIVGWILFPLVLGHTKLLWKFPVTAYEKLYDEICSLLQQDVPQLLKSVNGVNNISQKNKDFVFSWSVIETCHPYLPNQDSSIGINFEGAFASVVQFDKRCKTSSSDHLLLLNPAVNFTMSAGSKLIPVPIFTPSANLVAKFVSHDSAPSWGMKVYIEPIIQCPWLYELERLLAWVGARSAMFNFLKLPCTAPELKYNETLSSRLFRHGLEAQSTKSGDLATSNEFLQSFIQLQGEATALVEFMQERLKMEMGFKPNNFVLSAERGLIAAMLKHADLVGVALKFTFSLRSKNEKEEALQQSESETETESKTKSPAGKTPDIEVPEALLKVWRIAKQIRTWMIREKQLKHLQYASLLKDVLKRVQLLLKLQSCTWPTSIETQQEIGSASETMLGSHLLLSKSVDEHSSLASSSSSPLPDSNSFASSSSDTFTSPLSNITSVGATDLKAVDEVCNLVLKFVQQPLSEDNVDLVYQLVHVREERANNRANAIQLLSKLMTCTTYNSVKAEVINQLKFNFRSNAMKSRTGYEFHYLNNTEGCGVTASQQISSDFRALVGNLLNSLAIEQYLKSGVLRETFNILFFGFQPIDIPWMLEFNLLDKLCVFMHAYEYGYHMKSANTAMADQTKDLLYRQRATSTAEVLDEKTSGAGKVNPSGARKSGFNQKQIIGFSPKKSVLEEMKFVSEKAWNVFQMMAIRCITMLESWDSDVKHKAPVNQREHIYNNLKKLRDMIFDILLDELSMLITQLSNSSKYTLSCQREEAIQVLHDRLSLVVSVSISKCARCCLSTEKFQSLLLPLLKMGNSRIQEISLILCQHLMLHAANVSESVDDQFQDILLSLFQFLGAYELRHATGADVFSQQSATSTVSRSVAKTIFSLIRNILIDPSAVLREQVHTIIRNSLASSTTTLLELISKDEGDATNMWKVRTITKLTYLLASLTVLNGLSYIPRKGDAVTVKLNNSWESAVVVEVYEQFHKIRVKFTKRNESKIVIVVANNVHVDTQVNQLICKTSM